MVKNGDNGVFCQVKGVHVCPWFGGAMGNILFQRSLWLCAVSPLVSMEASVLFPSNVEQMLAPLFELISSVSIVGFSKVNSTPEFEGVEPEVDFPRISWDTFSTGIQFLKWHSYQDPPGFTRLLKSFHLPAAKASVTIPFYYVGGLDHLCECLLSSMFIGSGSIWWPGIPFCQYELKLCHLVMSKHAYVAQFCFRAQYISLFSLEGGLPSQDFTGTHIHRIWTIMVMLSSAKPPD